MQAPGTRSNTSNPLTLDPGDTIAARASAPGPAARSIVRLSGPKAFSIALAGFSPRANSPALPPRRAARLEAGLLRVTGLRPPVPVMLARWHGPRSYTGQDVAEIHMTGSVPILNLVLVALLFPGRTPLPAR